MRNYLIRGKSGLEIDMTLAVFAVMFILIAVMAVFIFLSGALASKQAGFAFAPAASAGAIDSLLSRPLAVLGENIFLAEGIIRSKVYQQRVQTLSQAIDSSSGVQKDSLIAERDKIVNYAFAVRDEIQKMGEKNNADLFGGRRTCLVLLLTPFSNVAQVQRDPEADLQKSDDIYFDYTFENGKVVTQYRAQVRDYYRAGVLAKTPLSLRFEDGGTEKKFTLYSYYDVCLTQEELGNA